MGEYEGKGKRKGKEAKEEKVKGKKGKGSEKGMKKEWKKKSRDEKPARSGVLVMSRIQRWKRKDTNEWKNCRAERQCGCGQNS